MKNREKYEDRIRTQLENNHWNMMNDSIFKFILGSEEHKAITVSFLNSVLAGSLGHRIEDIEFRPTEQIPENIEDKAPRFDVACELDTGELVDVEAQVVNYHDMERRSLCYWTNMYRSRLPKGWKYQDLRPCITLSILAFSLLPKPKPHSSYSIRENETYELLNEDLGLHFIELKKFLRAAGNKPASELTKMERWMGYFAYRTEKKRKELAMCDDSISMAYEAAEAFFSSREERMNYINSEMAGVDYRSGMQDAEDRGIKIGEERGEKRLKERMVKLLKILTAQNKMDDIAKITTDDSYMQELFRAYNI